MATGNQNPLDELHSLSQQVGQMGDLAALKPVFYRIEEIIKEFGDDFEVQLAASELKQKVIAHGTALRQMAAQGPPVPPPIPADIPKNDAAKPDWRSTADPLASVSRDDIFARSEPALPVTNIPPVAPPPIPPTSPIGMETAGHDTPAGNETWMGTAMSGATVKGPTTDATSAGPPPVPGVPPKPISPPRTEAPFPASRPQLMWKRSMLVGASIGILIAVVVIGYLLTRSSKARRATAPVTVALSTVPKGASIRVNGEQKCVDNCSVQLPPGDYQVTAFLDGYVAAAGALQVLAGQPGQLNLALAPQQTSMRIVTDFAQGRVTYDTEPAVDLQDGQFAITNLTPGVHIFRISTGVGDANFTVNIEPAKLPAVSEVNASKDWTSLLVSTMANRARAVSGKTTKLALNGQPQGDAGPVGLDLSGFMPGIVEFTLGEGPTARTMTESFGPAPSLVVMLKAEGGTPTIGTLIISSNEDDARVFINSKEYPRKTKGGQLRVQMVGEAAVRVAKDGFDVTPLQTVQIARGAEKRLDFKLAPIAKMSSLQIRGATPGAEVFIDQTRSGQVGDDGSFNDNSVAPGEHIVELRRENFQPRRAQRLFRAGIPISMSGLEVAMASTLGTVRVAKNPAEATVSYRRTDETQGHDLRAAQIDLPAGNYVFTSRAQGFTDKTERVEVVAGETHTVELAMARVAVAAAPPPPKAAGGLGDFEDPNAWSKQGDSFVHKGGGFIPFKLSQPGVFNFNVRLLKGGSLFRGGRIRWAVQFADAKNYDLFELDTKQLWSKVIIGGKTYERGKYEHGLTERDMAYNVQVEVTPEKLIHRIRRGNEWVTLDTWQEPGRDFTQGKFGFLIQGNDEIGLSDFSFQPR